MNTTEAQVLSDQTAGDAYDELIRYWRARPLEELIEYVIAEHHRPLETELHRLERLARKVLAMDGAIDPERLMALVRAFSDLRSDIEPHMKKEEFVLFPWILRAARSGISSPIRVMREDHSATVAQLDEIRRLTNDFVPPHDAGLSWYALWEGLEKLDRLMREHLVLEDQVLFPRALGS